MSDKRIVFFSIFLFIWIDAMAAPVSVPVGTVVAAQGKVYAQNKAGVKRLLQRRSEFYLHEIIMTQDKDSNAQLRLKDDTIITLKPNTKYAVNEFNLDAKNPKNNRYVANLVEGALISLSGQGKNNKAQDNHLLKTPVITIAIRGTAFEAFYKQINATAISGGKVMDGQIGVWANKGISKEMLVDARSINNAFIAKQVGSGNINLSVVTTIQLVNSVAGAGLGKEVVGFVGDTKKENTPVSSPQPSGQTGSIQQAEQKVVATPPPAIEPEEEFIELDIGDPPFQPPPANEPEVELVVDLGEPAFFDPGEPP
ncbi:MAG TPA: hypothetical protein DEA62_00455 [Coxiellaceae bacterium]|nr:hypothetical protein [Coxiellaceae bacterium]